MGNCASNKSSAYEASPAADAPILTAGGPREFAGVHDEPVNFVVAGRAGEWISCSEDGTIALTDWASGRVVQRWRGHKKGVNRVLSAPRLDGAFSASRDTTVQLWRRGEDEAVKVIAAHELTVSAIATDPANTRLFSGSRDSTVCVWDVASGRELARRNVSRNVVTCAAWVGDENVWQGSEDLRLRLWDVRTLQRPAADLGGYTHFPLACAAAGHLCLTGSNGFDNGNGCGRAARAY